MEGASDQVAVVSPCSSSMDTGAWAKNIVLPTASGMALALIIASVMHHSRFLRFLRWVPESALVMMSGAFIGGLVHVVLHNHPSPWATQDNFHEMSSVVLNLVLLPIIIFESGWSLRTKDFASQIVHILIFAIVGTLLSMVTVASLMMFLSRLGTGVFANLSWRLALCYGILISATDPVACLATYSSLKVEPLLNIIVFGESTINDAVAIAIFRVLNNDHLFTSREAVTKACVLNLLWLLFGSIVLGFVLAFGITLMLRITHMGKTPNTAMLFIYSSSFVAFSLAEGVFELSGIIVVLFESIFLGIYTRPLLSSEGFMLASFFLKQCASLSDMAVFLFAGVFMWVTTYDGLVAALWIMLFCLVGRAVAVFPLGVLVNRIKTAHGTFYGLPEAAWHKLSKGHLVAMWWAGLRGGIALVLCLDLGRWADEGWPEARQTLRNATFVVVCTFLVCFGGTTSPLLKVLGIPMGREVADDHLYRTATQSLQLFLRCLHRRVMLPILVGDRDARATLMAEEVDDDWSHSTRRSETADVERFVKIAQGSVVEELRSERGEDDEDDDSE
eukprot:TRINITY_DN20962_c0_g1_i1.p1 TRINITY_DN20962_c0_g1~~TRINITY_DN20962_c0_g1_i1.p1  ORF type:complete len:606 (-),score=142.83 TRINITY_DN20962_c0_g1_i1:194-1873(-)